MRILVVEDEPRIAADVASVLTGAGYVVETATDGEDAWFRGDTEAYDLIILDLGLPTMDGLSVLRHWRVAGRHMPVLILTARGAWPERVEGIDAGADDYLAKPFRMEELIARVRALIRRSVHGGRPAQPRHAAYADPPPRRSGVPLAARISAARLSHPSTGARRSSR